MTRAETARLAAATSYAVTLVCAWLLLPGRVEVVLGETDVVLDRWQYVLGAGLAGWALAAGTGGLGLGLGALESSFRTGTTEPGDLGTWLEGWVLLCACGYVWLQVVAGGSEALVWWQLGVVLVGAVGTLVLVGLRARSRRAESRWQRPETR
jgi:hypothetical protein